MIILAIIFTAWAILHKYMPRKTRTPVYEVYAPSAADIARREKERERDSKEAERARVKAEREAAKERKAEQETAQAKQDFAFYSSRLETLMAMETDTARSYYQAVETVEHDAQQNRYSYVIGEKTVQKHIAERDRLQSRLLKIQTQIHGVEKQLAKAKGILAS